MHLTETPAAPPAAMPASDDRRHARPPAVAASRPGRRRQWGLSRDARRRNLRLMLLLLEVSPAFPPR